MDKHEKKHVSEPLFHISKRPSCIWWKAWLIRFAAILMALIVSALVIYFITNGNTNPIAAYREIINGAIGNKTKTFNTLRDTMALLCIALAVTPAFKMKFWNIGAEGQVLMGALATYAVMYKCTGLPNTVVILIMFAVAIIAGGIWGVIPAIFKAQWNTNETLFTLMMNYIATQIVAICIVFWERPVGSNKVWLLDNGAFPPIFGKGYGLNLIVVPLIMLLMYIYLKYSKQGYEISVVGESENTARYAGINVKKVIIRTMAISGALCGLAGFLLVGGYEHSISTATAGGNGFTAIIVAWMAKLNPVVMFATSFLLVFLDRGASQVATKCGLNESASDIVTGIILFFIIGCEFFIDYKITFRKKIKEESK